MDSPSFLDKAGLNLILNALQADQGFSWSPAFLVEQRHSNLGKPGRGSHYTTPFGFEPFDMVAVHFGKLFFLQSGPRLVYSDHSIC